MRTVLAPASSGAMARALHFCALASAGMTLPVTCSTTVVNGDSEGLGLLLAKANSLDLGEGESTSGANLGVVTGGWWVNNGAEGSSDWARGDGSCLLLASETTCLLLGWLVEPGFHVPLP